MTKTQINIIVGTVIVELFIGFYFGMYLPKKARIAQQQKQEQRQQAEEYLKKAEQEQAKILGVDSTEAVQESEESAEAETGYEVVVYNSHSDFMPLSEGNWWEYKVFSASLRDREDKTKIKDDGSLEVFETTELVKIEVLKVARYKNVTVASFSNIPGGFLEEKATLLIMDNKDYYWTDADVFDSVVEKKGKITIGELESKWRVKVFSLPLVKDTLFNCDEEDKSRGDNYYCDWVRSIKPANQKYFPGKIEYEIAQYTLPDESHEFYIEGVGMTYYSYSHHGSIEEKRWNLQRYSIGTE